MSTASSKLVQSKLTMQCVTTLDYYEFSFFEKKKGNSTIIKKSIQTKYKKRKKKKKIQRKQNMHKEMKDYSISCHAV